MIKNNSDRYSIYNIQTHKDSDHPLAFLESQSERGWHVARNLLKPLNHLDFLKEKEQIAQLLNLHNLSTSKALFDFNYRMLETHQENRTSTHEVITVLAEQLDCASSPAFREDIRKLLCQYAAIRHMEFHPTDHCNLTCRDCTYGHDNEATKPLPINFSFDAINRIASMQPKSMVIIGGGEPTLYVEGKKRFPEVVAAVSHFMPETRLALVTNGTYLPPGDWPKKFSWIRISLDAASPQTYSSFRGKNQFKRVISNYLKYLEFDLPYVGISFLFAKSNVHEYAKVAHMIYNLVSNELPQHLHKVNIQYRPLRKDPYHYNEPFTEAISEKQITRVVEEVIALARSSKKMEVFLREQTNISAILGGNSHPPLAFDRCYYSQTFKIVRANGDLRPCFIRVTEPDFLLGNLNTDSLESIALRTLLIGARKKPHCDPHGCRQCHVNHVFEQGLIGTLLPSTSPAVLSDPMY